jgi:hypothetical protein
MIRARHSRSAHERVNSMRPVLKKILIAVALLVFVAAAFAVHEIGFSNIVGMLRYDQRREGNLKVGDKAPDVVLGALARAPASLPSNLNSDQQGARNSTSDVRLLDALRGKPLILIFGSYT